MQQRKRHGISADAATLHDSAAPRQSQQMLTSVPRQQSFQSKNTNNLPAHNGTSSAAEYVLLVNLANETAVPNLHKN